MAVPCGSESFCLGYWETGKQAFVAEETFEPIRKRLVEFHLGKK